MLKTLNSDFLDWEDTLKSYQGYRASSTNGVMNKEHAKFKEIKTIKAQGKLWRVIAKFPPPTNKVRSA